MGSCLTLPETSLLILLRFMHHDLCSHKICSFPVEDIKRTLDAMSWVKMNSFHWHIVDSQSFPLVIPGYPTLSAKGAYDSQSVYTAQAVDEIVKYANAVAYSILLLRTCQTDDKTTARNRRYSRN